MVRPHPFAVFKEKHEHRAGCLDVNSICRGIHASCDGKIVAGPFGLKTTWLLEFKGSHPPNGDNLLLEALKHGIPMKEASGLSRDG